MITLEKRKTIDPQDWKRLVHECDGNALHFPDIHQMDNAPRTARYLTAVEDGTVIACALAYDTARRALGLALGARTLLLPTTFAVREDMTNRTLEIHRQLVTSSDRWGYDRLAIGRAWGEDFSNDEVLSPCIVSRAIDFTIDLTKSIDGLLSAMDKYHRKNIRRAERREITLVSDSSEDGLLKLRELQNSAASRKSRAGAPGEEFFRRLSRCVYKSGSGDVLFAQVEGQHVAGLAYIVGGRKAQTVRSGSTDIGNDCYATYLLQYELMLRLKKADIAILNIGAVPSEAVDSNHPQHGLYNFKRGFGGQPNTRTDLSIPLRGGTRVT